MSTAPWNFSATFWKRVTSSSSLTISLRLRLPAEVGQMATAAVKSPWFHCSVHHRHTTCIWTGQRCRRPSVTRWIRHRAIITRRTGRIAGSRQRTLASSTALRLERQQIPGTTVSIYCNTSAGKPRPYVPTSLCLQVFQSVHDLSHPGTKVTAKLVAQRFRWPGMQKDCRTWEQVCQACQRSKVSRHTVTPVGDFTLPATRFLVGPLPTSAGYTYCLTAVDRFTRWP
jgi:hypothetical protein